MAKALSPVRLQDDLMKAAQVVGEQEHRSAAEQVEYWASLGRKITNFVSTSALLDVSMGLLQIKLEPTVDQPLDPDAVFDGIELRRDSGTLNNEVTTATEAYQASNSHPGYLEKISKQGERTIGTFQDGVFKPLK